MSMEPMRLPASFLNEVQANLFKALGGARTFSDCAEEAFDQTIKLTPAELGAVVAKEVERLAPWKRAVVLAYALSLASDTPNQLRPDNRAS